jgi:hypothetical protein
VTILAKDRPELPELRGQNFRNHRPHGSESAALAKALNVIVASSGDATLRLLVTELNSLKP